MCGRVRLLAADDASNRDSDELVRLGAKLAAERFEVPMEASAVLYDACVGCGGWIRAFREVRPVVQFVGIDISVGIIEHTSALLPDGVFFSGGGTDPPTPFLPDNLFDIVVAGFCLNNIAHDTYLRVFDMSEDGKNLSTAGTEMPEASRIEAMCLGVRDLYRVVKPGGGIYIPQYYEQDATTAHKKWRKWPLHLLGSCFPDLELTKEDEKPACNVRVRGGVVYTWEDKLYEAINYKDWYYSGKMKTVFIHKPINVGAVAVRNCTMPSGYS